jgi:hypothetical protein
MRVVRRPTKAAGLATAALASAALLMVNACVIVRIADSAPDATAESGAGLDATPGDPSDASRADGPPTGSPVDLATSQQTPVGILLDATHVYWMNLASASNPGAIMRLPKGGGAAAPGVFAPALTSTYAMCADSTFVYRTARDDTACSGSGTLFKHQKTGGMGTQISGSCNIPFFGCAAHAGIVYWAAADGVIRSTRDDGTAPAQLASVATARLVAADGANVYIGAANQIMMSGNVADAGDIVVFANAPAIAGLAIDATTVFWVDGKGVHKLGKTAPGAPPTDLALAQDGASAIALDESNVYWTSSGDGTVKSASKNGGPITVLAKGEGDPRGIAADATGVYWTSYGDGRVRAIRR